MENMNETHTSYQGNRMSKLIMLSRSLIKMCKRWMTIITVKRRVKSNCACNPLNTLGIVTYNEENIQQCNLYILHFLLHIWIIVIKTFALLNFIITIITIKRMKKFNCVYNPYISLIIVTNNEKNIQHSNLSNINNLDILYSVLYKWITLIIILEFFYSFNYVVNIINNNDYRNKSEKCLSQFWKNTNTQPNIITNSNDTECIKHFNENIESETIAVIDNIRSSSTGKTSEIIPCNINKTSVNNSTATAITPATTINETQTQSLNSQFKSYIPDINTQQDVNDELCLPLSYQYMFDKRTSPWEMKDWDQDELNAFVIQADKIDRLYHMVADDEDQNNRSWEICCRMEYKGEKYFVDMYSNCDYTGFDCQGGGYICITKLPDFFLSNMVTMDQNPDQIYKSLVEDDYNVEEPDPLHKMHPKFWNNAPMLKYLCHDAIYKNRDVLSHFKEQLPKILANSVDDFIKVKDWENE